MKVKNGVVVSKSGIKTIVVRSDEYRVHPKYKKRFTISRKFHAHDEAEQYNVGDKVTIYETRPLSKLKHWTVTEPTKE